MKKRSFCLFLILALFLLCGCVFPLQRVSPDPTPAPTPEPTPTPTPSPTPSPSSGFDPSDFAIPAPGFELEEDDAAAQPAESASLSPLAEPKLAVFWYAMADAQVFALREQFGPALEGSGLPYREFDAENDRSRQQDQVRDAVNDGWNILAVQLVQEDSLEEAEEIVRLAAGCPVLFFDRIPEPALFPDSQTRFAGNVGMICSDPSELGRVQGEMIGEFLVGRFGVTDLNQDGQISYTCLLGDRNDPAALTLRSAALDTADAVLAREGYRPLVFMDSENADGFQADPEGLWSSDAGTELIRSDIQYYNYANGNMLELIVANNDDMALGALTALQSAMCNLGDGSSATIPLFGIGGSAAARSAVSLGQMAGTVDRNAAGYARAVIGSARGLAEGRSAAEVFASLADTSSDCSVADADPSSLHIAPLPVSS